MLTVVGAGSVGLTLAARLARAGEDVLVVARDPRAAHAIREDGIALDDPGSGGSFRARADATADLARDGHRIGADPVLFCLRGPHTAGAARTFSVAAPGALAVCVQNGVDNEALLARHFETVIGGVYRQTCTRITPNAVRALGDGRIVLGLHPEGRDGVVDALAARLAAAGYDVGVSDRIGEDKWLKLCVNLMSAPNALIRREDHTSEAFVEIKARLLEEASAALAAAGVAARSCDGRDRSLEQEIDFQRTARARGRSARRLPVYNDVWRTLHDGAALEADAYHERILALAHAHGTPAPANRAVRDALVRAHAEGDGPGCLAAEPLLRACESADPPQPA